MYVYLVYQNSDLMEGKGRMLLKGIFADPDIALDWMENHLSRNMGGRLSAEIQKVRVVVDVDDYESMTNERIWESF